jgi:predicted restriction endonuclease
LKRQRKQRHKRNRKARTLRRLVGRLFLRQKNRQPCHKTDDFLATRLHPPVMETQLTEMKMQQAQIDKAYFNAYLCYIETGATEAEAVMAVAGENEISVGIVYDALVRKGVHNPCGQSEAYCY